MGAQQKIKVSRLLSQSGGSPIIVQGRAAVYGPRLMSIVAQNGLNNHPWWGRSLSLTVDIIRANLKADDMIVDVTFLI